MALVVAGFLVAGTPGLETARDRQDSAALSGKVSEYLAAAAKSPGDAAAQYRAALACSYLAEVTIERHDRKQARRIAEQGIPPAERAVALQPKNAEYYRVLGTLYGQSITDIMSGLNYGPKAHEAVDKAVELAPKSAAMYVARGVGNYYLPAAMGGGAAKAIDDFRKAISLDPRDAEAYLWLGIGLRKENKEAEARQAFQKSLQLNPDRVWTKQQLEKTPAQ
jgi:cytochrome c-type biogenesis protein CcmH/NrfG